MSDPAPHHYTEDITYHTLDAKENLHVNNAENNSSQATSHEAHFGDNCQVSGVLNRFSKTLILWYLSRFPKSATSLHSPILP